MENAGAHRGAVYGATLTYWQHNQELRLSVGTTQWYAWLESAVAFRFTGEHGTFTAHKARSGNGRGGWYWRAYRRHQGRLSRCYLGKSADLSLERLEQSAQQLSGPSQVEVEPGAPTSSLTDGESEEALILTRLFIPRLPMQHIPRPHLLALLDRAVETSTLVLVSAPAGSGKTTLLAEWSARRAETRGPLRVAWLALESADDDVVRWLTYLSTALAHFDPRIGQQARALLRATRSSKVEQVLTSLVNDLATCLTQDSVLILDDYHLVTAPAIHQTLLFLLEHMPQCLRLVIGTRIDPPLPLARLRARGQLGEFSGEDLRFTSAEAAAFLREMGLELSIDDLNSLEQRAEGWIAGLQLLALALRGRANPAALLKTFAGSHRFLTDYLRDEVLQRQTVELRDFLLRTSLLDRLCGPLCDALTGRSDGTAMLAELRRDNLFISALDEGEQWYRYHPLFAAALRELLQHQEPGQNAELYRRAGAWYRQQDLPFQAIDYLLLAGDFSQAAAYMEPLARHLVRRGDLSILQRWVELLPDQVLFARAHLCLAAAWVFLFNGQDEKIQELMTQVEGNLRAHQQENAPPEWQELRGELQIFKAVAALPFDDTDKAVSLAQSALEALPGDSHYLRNLASLCIAIAMSAAHRIHGDMAAAEKALAQVRVDHLEGYHFLSMIAMHDLAELYQMQGHLRKMARHYEQLLSPLPAFTELPTLLLFMVCADYASLLYEWNRLDEAAMYIERTLQAHNQEGGADGMFSLIFLLQANIFLAQGRVTEALQILGELDTMVDSDTIPLPMLDGANAQRALILLNGGHLDKALPWARSRWFHVEDPLAPEHFLQHMALARVFIAQARHTHDTRNLAEILTLLARWQEFNEQRGFNGLLIETLTLKALAFEADGKMPQALVQLGLALKLAKPENYIRTFVDKGEPMALLLARLAARPAGEANLNYIQFLLASMPDIRPATPGLALVESLTPREQEVLALLASGSSNLAIAGTLVITPNTAKRHVKHILGKLGADNRIQAVMKARELNLL